MAEYLIQDTTAQGIIDKVKIKAGITGNITGSEVEDAIGSIVTLKEGTADATATASDMANGVTAYVNGEKVTGNVTTRQSGDSAWGYASKAPQVFENGQIGMEATVGGNGLLYKNGSKMFTSSEKSNFGDATAADVLSGKTFTSSAGLKVAGTATARTSNSVTTSNNTVTIPAGLYSSSVTKTVGTAKSATTYTPKTTNQTIASGTYLTGTQTIKGDSNLVASNIKSGVSIFGVTGSYKGKYDVSNMSGSALRVNGYTIGICFDFDITGKEISGFVRIYDINGDNAVVLFDWFNFDTYNGRNGLSLMAPDGTVYAGFMVSETEGVSNSISIYTDNIYLSTYSNSRGVICYNL